MRRRRSRVPTFLVLTALAAILLIAVGIYIPEQVDQAFGVSSPSLNSWQHFYYGAELLWGYEEMTTPRDPTGAVQTFKIDLGDTAASISTRLELAGLIRSAQTFRAYLIWTGMDTAIPAGTYQFSPAMTGLEIARQIQTAAGEVEFDILAGWRMEEIAAALPASGLTASSDSFLGAASRPADPPDFLPPGSTCEGFLMPGAYTLPRSTTSAQLVAIVLHHFGDVLTPDLRRGFASQGLTIYQAVILASIVQREAVISSEMPLIASVFYNRLAARMKLESDPTVQFSLGFNATQGTWWTNPLSLDDLKVNSPYNTYLNPGLPPGPISNPGLDALEAVADPAHTSYLYFRARCDGSGLHSFAETFEQHLQNACP